MIKRLFSVLSLVVLLFSTTSLTVNASVEKVIPLNFNVIPTEIDITVPLNISVSVNPNDEDGFVYANNLYVTNNSTVPIDLKVTDFREVTDVFDTDILPSELPDGKTWDDLSVVDTHKYFSIGLKATDDTQWLRCDCTNPVYAKSINESGSGVILGVVDSSDKVDIGLEASYGRAFEKVENVQYNIVWIGTLYSE